MTIQPEYNGIDKSYSGIKVMAIANFNHLNNVEKDAILNCLKIKSEGIINSKRRFDEIKDLETYLRVLENRDALSSRNISELMHVYSVMGLNVTTLTTHTQQLLDVERRLVNKPTCKNDGEYKQQKNTNVARGQQRTNTVRLNNVLSTQPKPEGKLPDEVINIIVSDIGYSWSDMKSLARYLKVVPESLIDSIEANKAIRSNEIRAKLILAEFERNINPSEKNIRMKKALRLVERMDVLDKVENLFPLV